MKSILAAIAVQPRPKMPLLKEPYFLDGEPGTRLLGQISRNFTPKTITELYNPNPIELKHAVSKAITVLGFNEGTTAFYDMKRAIDFAISKRDELTVILILNAYAFNERWFIQEVLGLIKQRDISDKGEFGVPTRHKIRDDNAEYDAGRYDPRD